ncbi:hypothetical protein TNCV_1436231 [Trichonephila clavipes]|nr:hypothetical protein TNCV_1436231 [Trichonephila clavipes]
MNKQNQLLSEEQMDLDDDEIEEEKLKLLKRKLKTLSRMTVAKLKQKVNLNASSNIALVPQHWSLKRKYLQDKRGIEKLAWKLVDFIKQVGIKVQSLRDTEDQKKTKFKMKKEVRFKLRTHDNIFWDSYVKMSDYCLTEGSLRVADISTTAGETLSLYCVSLKGPSDIYWIFGAFGVFCRVVKLAALCS